MQQKRVDHLFFYKIKTTLKYSKKSERERERKMRRVIFAIALFMEDKKGSGTKKGPFWC